MSNVVYVLLGLFIMFTGYFIVTFGLGTLYFWVSKVKISLVKDLVISLTLAASGFFIGILSMIVLSQTNIFILASVIAVFGALAYYSLLRYLWKFKTMDAVIMTATLVIILNPAWFRLIGVL